MFGASPSGKASAFGADRRRFESYRPSQGPLAQWQSTRLLSGVSMVRIHHGPPFLFVCEGVGIGRRAGLRIQYHYGVGVRVPSLAPGGSSSAVEHRLAKARAAGSNPVFRSNLSGRQLAAAFLTCRHSCGWCYTLVQGKVLDWREDV